MGRISLGRVVLGGLLAGLIVNIGEFIFNALLFGEEMNQAMAALNRPPVAESMIVWFVLFGFGLGFMLVWVYAAIRPRFGPGVRTAVCASLAVWGLAYLYPGLFFIVMNLFPRDMMLIGFVWGLGEVVVAGIAGAWLYTESTVAV
jgi:pimeloyl-ACP methyl ester carboxylesterase